MSKKDITVWGSGLIIVAIICAIWYHINPNEEKPSVPETNITQQANLPQQAKQSDVAFGITKAMKGETIAVRANVVSMTSGKGHYFPVLKDPANQKTIKGVLFKNDADEDPNRKELLERRRKDGELLSIDGIVDIYDGELEIIIKKVY